jgi:hypothetical protein
MSNTRLTRGAADAQSRSRYRLVLARGARRASSPLVVFSGLAVPVAPGGSFVGGECREGLRPHRQADDILVAGGTRCLIGVCRVTVDEEIPERQRAQSASEDKTTTCTQSHARTHTHSHAQAICHLHLRNIKAPESTNPLRTTVDTKSKSQTQS